MKNKKFKPDFISPLTSVEYMMDGDDIVSYKEKGKVTKVKFPNKTQSK